MYDLSRAHMWLACVGGPTYHTESYVQLSCTLLMWWGSLPYRHLPYGSRAVPYGSHAVLNGSCVVLHGSHVSMHMSMDFSKGVLLWGSDSKGVGFCEAVVGFFRSVYWDDTQQQLIKLPEFINHVKLAIKKIKMDLRWAEVASQKSSVKMSKNDLNNQLCAKCQKVKQLDYGWSSPKNNLTW